MTSIIAYSGSESTMRPMRDNPCNGCVAPRRYPGCHDTCIDRIIAKAFHEAELAIEREKAEPGLYTRDVSRERKARAQKRRRKFSGYNFPL